MDILVFGELESITGSAVLTMADTADTDTLLQQLYTLHPALKEKQFLVAVDQQVIREKTIITRQTSIALLPPFSGG